MTAIVKVKSIHGYGLQSVIDYGLNPEKTSLSMNGFSMNDISNALHYASNPLKTIVDLKEGEKELLANGVLCTPSTAAVDFGLVRERYIAIHGNEEYSSFEFYDKRTDSTRAVQKEPIIAFHIIQSFLEDIDPKVAHEIGLALCNRMGVQGVVCTHMNTDKIHNHIIINSYMPDYLSKYPMKKDTILKIRELSDSIQQEYGIEIRFMDPRSQLYQSKGKDNYHEWTVKKSGTSWKVTMMQDIATIRSISDSKEEFLRLMSEAGYAVVKQDRDSAVYWNLEHTKKIRDRTLGPAYTLANLFPEEGQELDIEVQNDSEKRKHPDKIISVSRYTWDGGRRRSDLELLLLKAIAIIKFVGNRYHYKNVISSHTATTKIQMMEEAIKTVQELELQNKQDIDTQMDKVGAELSHVKKQHRDVSAQKEFYDKVGGMLSDYQMLAASVSKSFSDKIPDLMISSPSEEAIRLKQAALVPMSGEQKQELYISLMNSDYKLKGKGFDAVSGFEAEKILAFLKGKSDTMPKALCREIDSTMDFVYERSIAGLKAKANKPLTPKQQKEASVILAAHGRTVDLTQLKSYHFQDLINCWGPQPFSEPPISKEQQDKLQKLLKEQNLRINRPVEYILPSEHEQLLDYLHGVNRNVPSLLKSCGTVSQTDIEKLKTYMEAKGITSSIPLDSLVHDKFGFNKLYNYVLAQGHIPECIKELEIPDDKTPSFLQMLETSGYTEEQQFLLLQFRNLTVELMGLGVSLENPVEYLAQIDAFSVQYKELTEKKEELGHMYYRLVKLKQQSRYAESNKFLYGPLFDEKKHEKIQVQEKDETDSRKKAKRKDRSPDIPSPT